MSFIKKIFDSIYIINKKFEKVQKKREKSHFLINKF